MLLTVDLKPVIHLLMIRLVAVEMILMKMMPWCGSGGVVDALVLNVMCWQPAELYISHTLLKSSLLTDSPLGRCSTRLLQSEAVLPPHWSVLRNPALSLAEWRGGGLRGRE